MFDDNLLSEDNCLSILLLALDGRGLLAVVCWPGLLVSRRAVVADD